MKGTLNFVRLKGVRNKTFIKLTLKIWKPANVFLFITE